MDDGLLALQGHLSKQETAADHSTRRADASAITADASSRTADASTKEAMAPREQQIGTGTSKRQLMAPQKKLMPQQDS